MEITNLCLTQIPVILYSVEVCDVILINDNYKWYHAAMIRKRLLNVISPPRTTRFNLLISVKYVKCSTNQKL